MTEGTGKKIEEIASDLKISNPIVIFKTGYGIHKLKTIIGHRTLDKLKNGHIRNAYLLMSVTTAVNDGQ